MMQFKLCMSPLRHVKLLAFVEMYLETDVRAS